MHYETADGSHFTLTEAYKQAQVDKWEFDYTCVTAYVEGIAYAGKVEHREDEVDDVEVMECLQPIPIENIQPLFPDDFTRAPPLDKANHYLKVASLDPDALLPGNTFIAEHVLREARTYEILRNCPHINIPTYYGCVISNSRISGLLLKRYARTLDERVEQACNDFNHANCIAGVKAGIQHLHSLGLAHNDIHPTNICFDEDDNAAIIDFDSCHAIGKQFGRLDKAGIYRSKNLDGLHISSIENDLEGLKEISNYLNECSAQVPRSGAITTGESVEKDALQLAMTQLTLI